MDESGDSRGWVKVALIGTACVASGAAAYYAYSYYSRRDQSDGGAAGPSSSSGAKPMPGSEVELRLRAAKAIQMRALTPSMAPKSKAAAPKAAPAAGGASGGAKSKLCAECGQPLTGPGSHGLPQRCSSCKTTYYCSKECQKAAWPQHKNSCKASKPASPAASPAAPAAPASASAAEASTSAASPATPEQGVARKAAPTMEESLASVLEESAASKEDQLESLFETSVMLFLRGDYRGSVAQLLRVQELARSRGEVAVEGEVYKWLGHCWGKLSDITRSETYFNEGAEFARSKGLVKVEVDCLGGLGMMYRGQNDPARAMLYLGRALELAEKLGDMDLKAGMMCNMGNVLMQVDPEAGIKALQEAVALRELTIERLHDAGERAGLATAVMEHATAMVNLASALYVCHKLEDAKSCYERALEVFELVEDSDKVVKVLVNLANMCELQIQGKPDSRQEAAAFRDRLLTFLQRQGARVPEDTCAICLDPLNMAQPSAAGKQLILLACIHCFHDACWNKHMAAKADGAEAGGGAGGAGAGSRTVGVECPTCRTPVVMFE